VITHIGHRSAKGSNPDKCHGARLTPSLPLRVAHGPRRRATHPPTATATAAGQSSPEPPISYALRRLGTTVRSIEVSTTVRGKVLVGPNGLARPVPRSARVTITGKDPYDLDIRLNWDDDEQRLVPDDVRINRRADGRPIRVAELARIRFGDTIAASLATEVLDTRGWAGIIEDHPRADPPAVDALIYSLAHALGTHNPTQTVGLARGLQPGSAIKRVMRARELGYLGEAQKGRSGGLAGQASA